METYEASFKKSKSNKLLWVECEAISESEAGVKLKAFVSERHENKGYRLYGGPSIKKPQLKTFLIRSRNGRSKKILLKN